LFNFSFKYCFHILIKIVLIEIIVVVSHIDFVRYWRNELRYHRSKLIINFIFRWRDYLWLSFSRLFFFQISLLLLLRGHKLYPRKFPAFVKILRRHGLIHKLLRLFNLFICIVLRARLTRLSTHLDVKTAKHHK